MNGAESWGFSWETPLGIRWLDLQDYTPGQRKGEIRREVPKLQGGGHWSFEMLAFEIFTPWQTINQIALEIWIAFLYFFFRFLGCGTQLYLPNEGIWMNLIYFGDGFIGQAFCSSFHPVGKVCVLIFRSSSRTSCSICAPSFCGSHLVCTWLCVGGTRLQRSRYIHWVVLQWFLVRVLWHPHNQQYVVQCIFGLTSSGECMICMHVL